MFRSQQIIVREYVCTSLKLLNYLKNTEFKILNIIPGVVAGIRGDPCRAVRLTDDDLLRSKHFGVFLCILTLKSAI